MARVGIDLDGVCYDFAASLRRYLWGWHRFEESACPEPTRWEFYEDWGLSLKDFLRMCHEGVDAGVIFTWGNPFPGVTEALSALRRAGHTLHVVTDRSFGSNGRSEAATRSWLDRHRLPFDSITFTSDKTVVRADYFIDDKIENYDALHAAGVEVYLFDRPWNQANGHPRDRVSSFAEFVEKVK